MGDLGFPSQLLGAVVPPPSLFNTNFGDKTSKKSKTSSQENLVPNCVGLLSVRVSALSRDEFFSMRVVYVSCFTIIEASKLTDKR